MEYRLKHIDNAAYFFIFLELKDRIFNKRR